MKRQFRNRDTLRAHRIVRPIPKPVYDFKPNEIAIRSGSGLGDSIYLASVARYFLERKFDVEICTKFPQVFRQLHGNFRTSPFRRHRINRVAHYASRKFHVETDQFQDCCISAGVTEPIDLRLDWMPHNKDLVQRVRRVGKPVIFVGMPRSPMGRFDGFGEEVMPNCSRIQDVINFIGSRACFIQVGSGTPTYKLRGIDIDLANQTSVADVIDLGCVVDGFLGFCSFVIPLAESFNKPALLVWSRRIEKAEHPFVRAITPKKVLHKSSSRHVYDDCGGDELNREANGLLEQSSSSRAV